MSLLFSQILFHHCNREIDLQKNAPLFSRCKGWVKPGLQLINFVVSTTTNSCVHYLIKITKSEAPWLTKTHFSFKTSPCTAPSYQLVMCCTECTDVLRTVFLSTKGNKAACLLPNSKVFLCQCSSQTLGQSLAKTNWLVVFACIHLPINHGEIKQLKIGQPVEHCAYHQSYDKWLNPGAVLVW